MNIHSIVNQKLAGERAHKTTHFTYRLYHDTMRTQNLNWSQSYGLLRAGFWCSKSATIRFKALQMQFWPFQLHGAWCSVASLPAKLYCVQPGESHFCSIGSSQQRARPARSLPASRKSAQLDHLQPAESEPYLITSIQLRAISALSHPVSQKPAQLDHVQSQPYSILSLLDHIQPAESHFCSIASSQPRARPARSCPASRRSAQLS